jgi:proteic killer suppression protein
LLFFERHSRCRSGLPALSALPAGVRAGHARMAGNAQHRSARKLGRVRRDVSAEPVDLYSVTPRYTYQIGAGVIETLKHEGLRRLHEKNDPSGIRPDLVDKVRKILSALEAADGPEEMALPSFRFHRLTRDRRGTYSVTVKANWRITFRFHEGAMHDVNLEDYH